MGLFNEAGDILCLKGFFSLRTWWLCFHHCPFVCYLVGLFLRKITQKTTEWISTKPGKRLGHGLRRDLIDFGMDPDKGMLFHFL